MKANVMKLGLLLVATIFAVALRVVFTVPASDNYRNNLASAHAFAAEGIGDNTLEARYVSPESFANTLFLQSGFDCAPVRQVPKVECEAIVALASSASGGATASWFANPNICSWEGIRCEEGHIVSLTIRSGLTGTLAPEIGNLSHLRDLYLCCNRLEGSIPEEIGNLASAVHIELALNQLSGSIPGTLGNLKTLEGLELNQNNLTGSIPSELGGMTSLVRLDLSQNSLTGTIPPQLGDLENLVTLYLDRNELTGQIPSSIGKLTQLGHLFLYSNKLSGALPSEIKNLKRLWYLWLYDNQLTGDLPPEFTQLNPYDVRINDNSFTGPLPHGVIAFEALGTFHFYNTSICEPPNSDIQDWLSSSDKEIWGTGVKCAQPVATSTPIPTPVPDLVPPSGSIVINKSLDSITGATHSTSRNVELALAASDESRRSLPNRLLRVNGMRLSTNKDEFSAWVDYSETQTFSLDDRDGEQTVFAQFRDDAGNVSDVVSDTIILDRSHGDTYGISINSGKLWTNSVAVTLSVPALARTTDFQISNDGGFPSAAWQPYSLYKDWEITSYGSNVLPRVVYIRFRNTEGQISATFQDDIILDMIPPSAEITFVSLDSRELQREIISVDWNAQDDLSGVKQYEVQVQTDDGAWTEWKTGVTESQGVFYGLPGTPYRFRVRAEDNAENWGIFSEPSSQILTPGERVYATFLPYLER